MQQLGIYGASFKMAVLMNMFIQAFRYAFEPFFFARKNSTNDKTIYALIMKYFIVFGLFIFLGMMFYIDLIAFIFDEKYMEGLKVLPVILLGNLFFGIYFTLSLWYKLTDKNQIWRIYGFNRIVYNHCFKFYPDSNSRLHGFCNNIFDKYVGDYINLLFSWKKTLSNTL